MAWLDENGKYCDYLQAWWTEHFQDLPHPDLPGSFIRAWYGHQVHKRATEHPHSEMQRFDYVSTPLQCPEKARTQALWCNSEAAFRALLIFWDNELWSFRPAEPSH